MNLYDSDQPGVISRRRLLRVLLLLPALLVTCGSVFQGPVVGRIELDHPAEARDAVVFLRCRGSGLHHEVTTDSEHTGVGPDGRFAFLGSLTFPTTEHCSIYVRHPRYQTVRVDLADVLVQKLAPITLTSWDDLFRAGPDEELRRSSRYPWPQGEVYAHLSDTLQWLRSFSATEQEKMARYIPVVHDIYRRAYELLSPENGGLRRMLRLVGLLEEQTRYDYPFSEYLQAVKDGDAPKVQAFIEGGVLRETRYRGRSSTLSVAASNGHLDVMDVLLAHDEPFLIPGCGAPLLAAIRESEWPAALKLIRIGADTDISCQKRRPLGDAITSFARLTNLELLEEFFAAGVPVDIRNSRNTTALAEAATDGRIQSVKALLAAGANPDEHTAEGVKLIDEAVARGYLDVERELRLAQARRHGRAHTVENTGETISLPWRRGQPASYRVYSNYGQVNEIVADPKAPGVLWLATAGGLLRVVPASSEQKAWARVNGLPASAVQDLWFDQTGGYLWIATPAGLARMPLDLMDRVETVGSREPTSSFASGFLRRPPSGTVWYWSSGGIYHLEAEKSQALRYSTEHNPIDVVRIPRSNDFFVSDNGGLWRFNSLTGNREIVIDSEGLAALVDVGAVGKPQPRSLALDVEGRALWIGSHAHGLFRMDMDDGSFSRPLLTGEQIAQCARSKVAPHIHGEAFLAGGRTYAQLERCFGRIDDDNRFIVLRQRIDAGPVTDAGGNVWWLADGKFQRIDTQGNSVAFSRRPDPIGNARVNAILHLEEQLFVGVEDAPLAVFDLQRQTWSSVPKASNVQRLRTVVANDAVMALGQAHYFLVDPQALTTRELTVGPGSTGNLQVRHWQDLRDLEIDGDTLWVLRDNRQLRAGKSRRGLYRVAKDGYKHIDSASGYSLGVLARVVQDPGNPARLWLLRDNKLIDFDKNSLTSTLIGANDSKRRQSDLLGAAMSDPRLKTLTTRRHETLDPDAPDLVWGVQGSGLYLKHGARIIHRWPVKLPVGPIEVIRNTATTVWIASTEGLIAFPVEESLAELRGTGSASPRSRER